MKRTGESCTGVEARFVCYCLCGSQIYADDNYGLLHELPVCEPFARMEPDEFVTWLRKQKGLPSPHPEDQN